MNWKLLFQLSLFGLVMGLGTVFFIPSNIEPFCWLAIFLICAWCIAKQTVARRFLHGLCLGLANSFWITTCHIVLFAQYAVRHMQEVQMMQSGPLGASPRLMTLFVGIIAGLVSGLIIGLSSLAAAKMVKPGVHAAPVAALRQSA
jgi:hypothetical protein